jgi:hypothetical protein
MLMMRTRKWWIMVAAIAIWGSLVWAQEPAPAQPQPQPPRTGLASRSGHLNVGGDVGLTLDPDLFAGQVIVDYFITNEISVGPLFQGGTGHDGNWWGLSGQVKYSARLANTDIVRPYGQAGIGFINFHIDQVNHHRTKTSFLVPVGGGFEFELFDEVTLDTNIMLEASEKLFVGFFVGARYLF